MTIIELFDVISFLGFAIAFVFALGTKRNFLGQSAITFLYLITFLYTIVQLFKILQYLGLSDHFASYEDFLEILFIPFFLFFLYAFENYIEINERKQAEAEIKKFKTISDNANYGAAICSPSGHFLYLNNTMAKMHGYRIEELLGRHISVFQDQEQRSILNDALDNCLQSRKFFTQELEHKRKDDSIFSVLLHVTVIFDQDKPDYISITVIDVSEQKRLEQQLRQAQKMESIGTLAGGIAHDFNNLVQAISGYAQLLILDKAEDNPDYASLQEIDKASQRATELIKQLLTFSRRIVSDLKSIDINFEVMHAAQILERTIPKMVEIELKLDETLRKVNGDPNQLEQLCLNLGINASQAMPHGGKLIFETSNIFLDKDFCSIYKGAKEGYNVLLAVTDTGVGMEKEVIEHIFEPFFTTKEVGQGTGLGLAMVYGIVKNHGGHILCYSEVGSGTSFKLYFPAISDLGMTNYGAEIIAQEISTGHETVLLVDDEHSILDLGQRMLKRYGYNVVIATTGEEALEIYTADPKSIDLVILDLNMPGMGGYKCLEELIQFDLSARVIVSTGYFAKGSEEVLALGARGVVNKPYRLNDMMMKIRETLDQEKNRIN